MRRAIIRLFTIGFAGKSAEDFFSRLEKAGVQRVLDVRLNNVSQLSGFAKRNDLQFFLNRLSAIEYEHLPILAPTRELLDKYRSGKMSWAKYETAFRTLLEERRVAQELSPELVNRGCLLCSEDKAHQCHRRVIAEYLAEHWPGLQTSHL